VDELQNKYKTDTLSSDELMLLKEKINAMSDDELASQLQDDWMVSDIDTSSVDDHRMDDLKNRIDRSIGRKPVYTFGWLAKAARIAAAVLLPVFVLSTVYFYRQTRLAGSEEMVVTTGAGERANITLPDGTNVALNSNSRLAYLPKMFNKSDRRIAFSGEGYFQVHKDATRPFLIDGRGLGVKVLGTVFNLHVRENDASAELALEEGSVLFSSKRNHEDVVLEVGSMAILDQNTGSITVVNEKNITNAAAWKSGYLIYHETELSEVIKDMESNYGVTIVMGKKCLSDLFTGTVPSNDLNEALLILEKSYHLKSSRQGNRIVLK